MDSRTQTRRTILAAGVSGLAGGLVHARRVAAQSAEAQPAPGGLAGGKLPGKSPDLPPALKVSIAGYSFRDSLDKPGKPGKMSLFDLVDMAARWKIDAFEPTSYYFLKEDDEWVYALKRKAFLSGIEVSGMPVGNNFCLPPGDELKKQITTVKKWIDIAAKLGAPAIRIFAGSRQSGRPDEEVFKTLIPAIREACDYAGSRGIILAIENHGYMTETADALLRILDAAKHDWLGINLDTGNFTGDPYGQITKVAPLAVTCQVKGLVRPARGKSEPVDMARVVQIMLDAKYRGYVTLEYEEKDPHQVVPELLAKLQAAIRA